MIMASSLRRKEIVLSDLNRLDVPDQPGTDELRKDVLRSLIPATRVSGGVPLREP